jgi:hypothetical protein
MVPFLAGGGQFILPVFHQEDAPYEILYFFCDAIIMEHPSIWRKAAGAIS